MLGYFQLMSVLPAPRPGRRHSFHEQRHRRPPATGISGTTRAHPASESADCRIPAFHNEGTASKQISNDDRAPSVADEPASALQLVRRPSGLAVCRHLSTGVVHPFVQVEVRESGVLVASDPSLSSVACAPSGVPVPAPKLPSSVSESAEDEPGGAEYTLSL
jgi:hypothetical protein